MDAKALLAEFTKAATSGDGTALAALFTEDGVYVDNFYGPFEGRAAIKDMLETHFHGAARDFRWDMRDPVSDGKRLYAHYVFSYVPTMKGSAGDRVAFEGVAMIDLDGDRIRHYSEVFDRGVALAQLGFPAERIKKSLARWADEQSARPEFTGHLG